MNAFIRLFAIMRKEIRQLKRDRITFAMIVGIPIGQILLFGFAINTDVRDLNSAIANQSNSHLSREFLARLHETQVLDFRYEVESAEEIEQLLRSGNVSIGVYIPPDFDRRTLDRQRPAAHLLVDGTDPTIVGIANQLSTMPVGFDATGSSTERTLEVRPYYNPERRTAVNIIPGLIGIILTFTMTLFTAVAIVRERERGNLELLINTPISTVQLLVGKILPYVVIGLVQLALILAVGRLLFDVPILGSISDLYLASLVFIAANLALGLFISTIATTQFQSFQLTFFLILPSILLSGFMFPFEGMPKFAQYIGEVLPNTHFIRLTRGIMLRDATLLELGKDLFILGAIGIGAMIGAGLRFSKRLD